MSELEMSFIPTSPKRNEEIEIGNNRFYNFYPGYSNTFVIDLIKHFDLPKGSVILDPWNGSGTTTEIASMMGYKALGFDLNPVMYIVAKSREVSPDSYDDLLQIKRDISKELENSGNINFSGYNKNDPLGTWFTSDTVQAIRQIEIEIQKRLLKSQNIPTKNQLLEEATFSQEVSFFYVGLFRMLKKLSRPFQSTNPTWIKQPRTADERQFYSRGKVIDIFKQEMDELLTILKSNPALLSEKLKGHVTLGTTPSHSLPIKSRTIDLIVTSPPYCTRIDYPIMTRLELALLYISGQDFAQLRRQMIGSPLMNQDKNNVQHQWGETCLLTLKAIKNHPSKASKTYYYRTYLQYFEGIYESFNELNRVLKRNGKATFVVQNSFYKNIYVDLGKIFAEIGRSFNWKLIDQFEYVTDQSMVQINTRSKKYRQQIDDKEKEVVLIFQKRG